MDESRFGRCHGNLTQQKAKAEKHPRFTVNHKTDVQTHTFTPKGHLASAVYLTCLSLDYVRILVLYTHADAKSLKKDQGHPC